MGRSGYGVLGFACTLSMVTYLDRACFGAAAPSIAAELGLADAVQLKWAMTAFAVAYAAFEVPAGARWRTVGRVANVFGGWDRELAAYGPRVHY